MFESVTLTQLTGNLSAAYALEAIGGLIISIALAIVLLKFVRVFINMAEAAEKFSEQKYRNNTYYHTVVTAFKVAVIKEDGKDLNIEEEMGKIPTSQKESLTERLRKEIAEDINPTAKHNN